MSFSPRAGFTRVPIRTAYPDRYAVVRDPRRESEKHFIDQLPSQSGRFLVGDSVGFHIYEDLPTLPSVADKARLVSSFP